MRLTAEDKVALLECGRFGVNKGEAAWELLCDRIKAANAGGYPSDWWEMVVQGRLFVYAGGLSDSGRKRERKQEEAPSAAEGDPHQ